MRRRIAVAGKFDSYRDRLWVETLLQMVEYSACIGAPVRSRRSEETLATGELVIYDDSRAFDGMVKLAQFFTTTR